MSYRNQWLYLIIGIHLSFIMIQIYMYSIYFYYTYAIQKEERVQEQLQRTMKEYEQKVTAIQNLKTIKEKAITELQMEPLSLSKIHTIK
jgi:hypothetical protein